MNHYHFIVIGIIVAAIGIPAYLLPARGFWFKFGAGALITAVLAALLFIIMSLYFEGVD